MRSAGFYVSMQVAVLSDIHGNLPALEAVLEDISETGVEELWCLGDVVGYGASPTECTDLVRERCATVLVGNHDLAVLGALDTSTFSGAASAAVEWTKEQIGSEQLAYLGTLSPSDTSRPAALYHASPRDPVWEYVLWPDQAADWLIAHHHVPAESLQRSEYTVAVSRRKPDQVLTEPVRDAARTAAHAFAAPGP